MAKKVVKPKKLAVRLLLFFVAFLVIISPIVYSLFNVWKQIYDKNKEKENLNQSLITLKEEEEELKVELNKLKDSSYVAKYAREKLFYSEKDEYIIKIK